MNILYVSVMERAKEIGLRMSIGAKDIDILLQFLVYAILISLTGDTIGLVPGITVAQLVSWSLQRPILISNSFIVLSYMACAVTGVFFENYPAQKASRLNPKEHYDMSNTYTSQKIAVLLVTW